MARSSLVAACVWEITDMDNVNVITVRVINNTAASPLVRVQRSKVHDPTPDSDDIERAACISRAAGLRIEQQVDD